MKTINKLIEDLVKIELLKRGFIVDVTCTNIDNNRFKLESSEFQTIPIIFKRAWIWSEIIATEKESDKGTKYVDYYTPIYVRYETFDSGYNSIKLFTLVARKFESWSDLRIV